MKMNKTKIINKKFVPFLLAGLFIVGVIAAIPNQDNVTNSEAAEISLAAPYNYTEALQKAIYFYLAQRSGDLPDDNPVIWRDDSGMNDGADNGLDLTGGYYDAGDHVKFNLPMASTMFTLAWNVIENGAAIKSAGLYDEIIDAIRWGTDYFIKCNPNSNTYYFQVGDGGADHAWWGSAEVMTMARPSYKVTASAGGSAVCAATATALIATSIILETKDPAYAAKCLSHAQDLLALAEAANSDAYYDSIAGAYYKSWSGFQDEIATAKALMYMKTGQASWLTGAEAAAAQWGDEGQEGVWGYKWGLAWDDMHYIAQILLARETGKAIYAESVERNLDFWLPGGGIAYSPGGEAHLTSWGSLRHSSNTAMLAFIWADEPMCTSTKVSDYKTFGEKQINYVLGSNPRSSSYLIGFGANTPKNPHHRTAHGCWSNNLQGPPTESRHLLIGALVGGPKAPDDAYTDDRADYVMNEVAMDYNMGLIGALTYMAGVYGGSIISGFPRESDFKPVSERLPEFFANGRLTSEHSTGITVSVDLTNHAAWPAVSLDKMSFRYYFDISELIADGKSINDVTITKGYSEVPTTMKGPLLQSGTVYYIEVDYSGSAIWPGGQSESARETQLQFIFPSSWSSANDFSYDFTGNEVSQNDKIPVYNAGVLIGGQDIGPVIPDTTAPSTPSGLVATATGSSSISLNWNDNSESDLASYTIYRSTTSGFTPSGTTQIAISTSSSLSDTGLTEDTTYYYKVTAKDTSGNVSPASSQASATTESGTIPPPPPGDEITAPFTKDGAGEFTWKIASIPNFMNCWNLETLTINGVDFTNKYAGSWNLPAKVDGFYTIHYVGNYAWSHMEIK